MTYIRPRSALIRMLAAILGAEGESGYRDFVWNLRKIGEPGRNVERRAAWEAKMYALAYMRANT